MKKTIGVANAVAYSFLAREMGSGGKVDPVGKVEKTGDRRARPMFTHQDLVTIAGLPVPVDSGSNQGLASKVVTYNHRGLPSYSQPNRLPKINYQA
jgi:hypothetical protein